MGVKDLWSILNELCEKKPLTYLAGKKVAVDLSGWVMQAVTCKGLNTSKSPHLRNLFFRVSRLLQLDVYPIFVTEGKPPDLKEAALRKRMSDRDFEKSRSRSTFDKILDQCQELLNTLGVPCIKSSGEAEAFCALLCLKGIVDGVITEDSDAFLYGAEVVYRKFSIEPSDSHVVVCCLKSEKNKNNLDRRKLVALALLLGSDYNLKGVPHIGKTTAVKLLNELSCDDVLQRFEDWKNLSESELFPGLENGPLKKGAHCTHCGHTGSPPEHKKSGCSSCNSQFTCYRHKASNPCGCPWHVNEELMRKWKTELKVYNTVKDISDFPDKKVINEYLNFTDNVPSNEMLDWNCPNFMKFQDKVSYYLGWTVENSHKKFLPLITSWQQYRIGLGDSDKTDFVYEPVEVLKKRTVRGVTQFEVKWKYISDDCEYGFSNENVVTLEYGDRFSKCYKKFVSDFYELNEPKKTSVKCKKIKLTKGRKQIDEFFVKKRQHNKLEKSELTI